VDASGIKASHGVSRLSKLVNILVRNPLCSPVSDGGLLVVFTSTLF
jgi:hypothetical protein